jgi:hypothetical protein
VGTAPGRRHHRFRRVHARCIQRTARRLRRGFQHRPGGHAAAVGGVRLHQPAGHAHDRRRDRGSLLGAADAVQVGSGPSDAHQCGVLDRDRHRRLRSHDLRAPGRGEHGVRGGRALRQQHRS